MRWLNPHRESPRADGCDRARRPAIPCRPGVEGLESRLVPSGLLPANTLSTVAGDVSAPGGAKEVALGVAPRNLTAGRSSTVIGLFVQPRAGGLQPRIVSVAGPDGRYLPLTQQAHAGIGPPGSIVGFVRDARPGPLTVRVQGVHGTTGTFQVNAFLPGDVNGDGRVTLADLQALAPAYLARVGVPNYNPAADANLSGFIGINDARALQRNLPPLGPHVPPFLELSVVPTENVPHPGTYNSGAIVNTSRVTIRGRTAPGSLVFVDNSNGTYKFNGTLVPTDAQGNFTYTRTVDNHRFTATTDFLVINPSGQQLIRNYPIRVV